MMFDISFITLSWNSDAYLHRCVTSILAQCESEGLSGEILVVDNGSQDGSLDTIRDFSRRFPDRVRLTTLGRNQGTTYPRNLALKQAQGAVLCVLDSDTEFRSGSIRAILDVLREPGVGIVAPRLVLPDGTVQHSVKRFPTLLDKLRKVPRIVLGRPVPRTDFYESFPFEDRRRVESAISACWFFRRDLLLTVGYLDEAIFYSPEDVDYSMRVWKAGLQIIYDPALVLTHHTQQISHRRPISMLSLSHLKGLLHYHRKHGGWLRRPDVTAGGQPAVSVAGQRGAGVITGAGEGSPQPVRVVHLVNTLEIGGLEKVVLDLVRCRTRDTYSMRVICMDDAGVLRRHFEELRVPVETIGQEGSVPRRILRLARRLKQLQPHVVHTHNPKAHLHGTLAARLAGVPVVVHTKHGRGYPDRPLFAMFSRLALRWTSDYIAVSEDAALVAREVEGVPAGRLHVIHNGIDMDRFARVTARPAGPGRRAVTVGRLDPIKDHATLLRAMRLVVDAAPAFQLDIIGDGPTRQDLERLCRDLGLTAHVHFHGYRAEVRPYLGAADFFVLPSISEGVSLALLEAMASGLPAVATDVGGNREVVIPEETGYLVPARSPEVLAEVMLRIQGDTRALARMSDAARRRVEQHFNLRSVVAAYEDVYQLRLHGGATRPGRAA